MKENKKFVIYHFEPELYEWSFLEYKNISRIVGKDNLIFVNVDKLNKDDIDKLKGIGNISNIRDINLEKSCLLDPEADELLTYDKAKNFDYFIFGGILGNDPAEKRTGKIKLDVRRFNIGRKQFPTDNAVFVVKEIINGRDMEDMKFVDKISLSIEPNLDIDLNFRYVVVDGKPLISKEVIDLIKRSNF